MQFYTRQNYIMWVLTTRFSSVLARWPECAPWPPSAPSGVGGDPPPPRALLCNSVLHLVAAGREAEGRVEPPGRPRGARARVPQGCRSLGAVAPRAPEGPAPCWPSESRRPLHPPPRHLLVHSCPRLVALRDFKSVFNNMALARPGFGLQAPVTSARERSAPLPAGRPCASGPRGGPFLDDVRSPTSTQRPARESSAATGRDPPSFIHGQITNSSQGDLRGCCWAGALPPCRGGRLLEAPGPLLAPCPFPAQSHHHASPQTPPPPDPRAESQVGPPTRPAEDRGGAGQIPGRAPGPRGPSSAASRWAWALVCPEGQWPGVQGASCEVGDGGCQKPGL